VRWRSSGATVRLAVGYSRELEEGVQLPRVISFCAALYSIGLPPDIIGLNVLTKDDLKLVTSIYPRFKDNIGETLSLWNPDVLDIVPGAIRSQIKKAASLFEAHAVNEEHLRASCEIIKKIKANSYGTILTDLITQAGNARGFLG